MIEPIDLNQFEETRYMEPPNCEDELAQQIRELDAIIGKYGKANLLEALRAIEHEKVALQAELKSARSQAIQARAQAATAAAERDELRGELKDTRDELSVYRLASETAMYEAGEFDAGLFLSGDRGVEDVMRRVLRQLDAARQSLQDQRIEAALWKRRAEAQLNITEAAINLTLTPLYNMQAANGAYYISPGHYERLRAACAEFKQLAESEAVQ